MRIFVGVPWRWGLKRQLAGENRLCLVISVAVSAYLRRVEAYIIVRRHEVSYRLSSDLKMLYLE